MVIAGLEWHDESGPAWAGARVSRNGGGSDECLGAEAGRAEW